MLFTSFEFLLAFLPATLLGVALIGRLGRADLVQGWLLAASLFFYGWWDLRFVPLLLGSILFNFAVGRALIGPRPSRLVLLVGVGGDLALLGWAKYAGFFAANLQAATGIDLGIREVVLPLGISFFTFTQIAYLVDAWRGEAKANTLTEYGLFVTIFPHLIAGPVLHHREMIPQFRDRRLLRLDPGDLAAGLSIFALGLAKKIVVADRLEGYATPVFKAFAAGKVVGLTEAWVGALAYAGQIYFDFSGYSDMAIGLGAMLGVRLPVNFDSPYKATSIIEFWRRWHMTLSAFLRDYLYIPLGGNRRGEARRQANLLATMLLGGLWHGAAWTFVAWGGLHGVFLVVNHAWRKLRGEGEGAAERLAGRLLTLLCVVAAWVFFRADSFDAALAMLKTMAGLGDLSLDFERKIVPEYATAPQWIGAAWMVALFAPNMQAMMAGRWPYGDAGPAARPRWAPTRGWAVATGVLLALGILGFTSPQVFIYFQF